MGFFDKFRRSRKREDEVAGILRNLEFLFSTRKGFGAIDERLGLSDTAVYTADRVTVVKTALAEIEENVRLFEPRVELISVTETGIAPGRRLTFKLELKLKSNQKPLTLHVGSDSEQRVKLSS